MNEAQFPPEPLGRVVVNYEQLEAENVAGCSVVRRLDVSLTTLAHLIMAAQYAMQAPTISAPAFAVLHAFATEAEAKGDFPTEMRKLIAAGTPGRRKLRRG